MGGNNSKKRKKGTFYKKHNKKAKRERFWIEDCKKTKVKPGAVVDIEVLITRAELEDDHHQTAKKTTATITTTTQNVPIRTTEVEELLLSSKERVAAVSSRHGEQSISLSATKPEAEIEIVGDDSTKNEQSPGSAIKNDETEETAASPKEASPMKQTPMDALEGSDLVDKESTKPATKEPPSGSAMHEDLLAPPVVLIEDTSTPMGVLAGLPNSKKGSSDSEVVAPDIATVPDPASQTPKILVCIKRAQNACRPYSHAFEGAERFEPLPNGDCGDGIVNPYPKEEVADKFWSQRRRLFSRFDEGIELDKESWYSVTPEAIANQIASHMVGGRRNDSVVVLDPFCGCGGNSIAFALRDEVNLVVGVDTDLEKLKKAAINAHIYGISTEKLVLIHGNACEVLSAYTNCVKNTGAHHHDTETVDNKIVVDQRGDINLCKAYRIGGMELLPDKIDTCFLSPPWGGMDYAKVGKRNYSLDCITIRTKADTVLDGDQLLDLAARAVGKGLVVMFLPRNINGSRLGRSAVLVGYNSPVILEQNVLNGKLKTVTAYLGL